MIEIEKEIGETAPSSRYVLCGAGSSSSSSSSSSRTATAHLTPPSRVCSPPLAAELQCVRRDGQMVFRKGDLVERELEGCWFPARITAVNADGSFDVFYTDDGNDEEGVDISELRAGSDESKEEEKEGGFDAERAAATEAAERHLAERKEEGEEEKAPTVVVHATDRGRAASAYIINGVETNIAAGNGIRGIRWLRKNENACA